MAITIFDAIKKDHEKMKGLFKQITRKKQPPDSIFPELQQELDVHLGIEEKMFYPYLREQASTRDVTLESLEEHNVARKELNEVSSISTTDEWFPAKMKVLQELVNHHIEEEETELFKKAKKVIGKQQAEEMAERYAREKQQIAGKSGSSRQS